MHTRHPNTFRIRVRWLLPSVIGALLAAGPAPAPAAAKGVPPPSEGDMQTVTIHPDRPLGNADNHLLGLLHGVSYERGGDYTRANDLLGALRPNSWRVSTYGGVMEYLQVEARFPQRFKTRLVFVIQDAFNKRYDQNIKVGPQFSKRDRGAFPTDEALEEAWRQNIRDVVGALQKKQIPVAYYDIFSEPNRGFEGLRPPDFLTLLKASVEEIRALDKNAKIVVPSLSFFSPKSLGGLFDYAVRNNIKLDAVCWHELDYAFQQERSIQPDELADHVTLVRQLMREKLKCSDRDAPEIHINEYQWMDGYYSPGVTAGWLYYLTKSGVVQASRACWEFQEGRKEWSTCWNSFCGLLTSDNQHPTALYWVYRGYSDMSGRLVDASTSDKRTVALASIDPAKKEMRVTLGRYGQDGTSPVRLTIASPPLAGQEVHATLYRIPAPDGRDQARGKPVVAFDRNQTLPKGDLSFVIKEFANDEAYILVLKPAS